MSSKLSKTLANKYEISVLNPNTLYIADFSLQFIKDFFVNTKTNFIENVLDNEKSECKLCCRLFFFLCCRL